MGGWITEEEGAGEKEGVERGEEEGEGEGMEGGAGEKHV